MEETSVLAEADLQAGGRERVIALGKQVGVIGRNMLEEDEAGEVGGSH